MKESAIVLVKENAIVFLFSGEGDLRYTTIWSRWAWWGKTPLFFCWQARAIWGTQIFPEEFLRLGRFVVQRNPDFQKKIGTSILQKSTFLRTANRPKRKNSSGSCWAWWRKAPLFLVKENAIVFFSQAKAIWGTQIFPEEILRLGRFVVQRNLDFQKFRDLNFTKIDFPADRKPT